VTLLKLREGILETEETIFDFSERAEVVGGEDHSLNDREIDFDLVEPTGVDRSVDQDDGGPSCAQAFTGLLTAMGGAIVGDPEDAPSGAVRLLGHGLFDETIERLDAGGLLAATEDLGAMDVPGGEVGPGAAALVFVLNASAAAGSSREPRVLADAGLDTGFLVGREHEVTAAQRRPFPAAFVEVEHTAGLGGELWIAGKNPASVSPGTKRVATEPTPERGAADLRNDSLGDDLPPDLGQREARQGKAASVGELAGERFNVDDDAGGKSGPVPRRAVLPRVRGNRVRRTVFATCSRSGAAYRGATR
jgi:hypothetical protein